MGGCYTFDNGWSCFIMTRSKGGTKHSRIVISRHGNLAKFCNIVKLRIRKWPRRCQMVIQNKKMHGPPYAYLNSSILIQLMIILSFFCFHWSNSCIAEYSIRWLTLLICLIMLISCFDVDSSFGRWIKATVSNYCFPP